MKLNVSYLEGIPNLNKLEKFTKILRKKKCRKCKDDKPQRDVCRIERKRAR